MDFHLNFTNSGENVIELRIEPWGRAFAMQPGATFEVALEAVGERGLDAPEVQWSADGITVYAGRCGKLFLIETSLNHLGEEQMRKAGFRSAEIHQEE